MKSSCLIVKLHLCLIVKLHLLVIICDNRHSTTRKSPFLVKQIPITCHVFAQGPPRMPGSWRGDAPKTNAPGTRSPDPKKPQFIGHFGRVFVMFMGFVRHVLNCHGIFCDFHGGFTDLLSVFCHLLGFRGKKYGRINCPIEGWSYKFRDIIGTNIFNWICEDSIILIQNHGRMDTNTQVIVGMYAEATHVHGTPVWMENNREPGTRIMLSSMENVESISPTSQQGKKIEINN